MNATILIIAASARALTEAARRSPATAGRRIVALDWFADQDLLAAADQAEAVPTRRAGGFSAGALLAAARRLAPEGSLLVAGSGFEARAALLARLARGYRLAGNPPAVLARVKDPAQFFAILDRLGVSHPPVGTAVPPRGSWLVKRSGGAGGRHVRPARRPGPVPAGCYAQLRVPGLPISLAFLADGRRSVPVGYTRQWPDPSPGRPFRYGGAVMPAVLPPALAARMADWAARLVPAFGLVGLNGADFVVDGDRVWLLEVNPRPGATLDLLDAHRPGLFQAHLEASFGRLAPLPAARPAARAAAILYAPRRLRIAFDGWPGWVADRPGFGSTIPPGGPVCTVFAAGLDAEAARRSALARAGVLLERLNAPVYA